MTQGPVLSVSGLSTSFRVDGEWRTVVDDVGFEIGPRQTVAIVGEFGLGQERHRACPSCSWCRR